jgi:hypothetical protein
MILGQQSRQTGDSCGFQRQNRLSPVTFQLVDNARNPLRM